MKHSALRICLLSLLIFSGPAAKSITPTSIDSIPMRDGKKLAGDVYIPAGCTSCPVILIQTPYNRQLFQLAGLPLGVGHNLNSSNYIYVVVDWRGFYGSAAAIVASPNRGEDGYDAIDWIVSQTWCNGKVGTWGPSALGVCQYQTAQEQHPNHTCAVPLVASPQFAYQEYFPGGVYRTEYVQQLDALGYGLSTILLSNPVKNTLWNFSEASTFYPAAINTPMFLIGGWYDHNPDGMLEFFNAMKAQSPVASEHKILMGPWAHGGNGAAYVGSLVQGELTYPDAAGWSDSLALLFFDYHLLLQANGVNTWPNVRYFQMGDDQWQTSTVWPPTGVSNINLYLHPNGIMGPATPNGASSYTSYVYNPSDPSPTIGGATLRTDLDQGPYDQAPLVESRNDILIFSTPVQTSPIMLKGEGSVHLFVSSDRKDTDFTVRVTDLYPDGRSMLLMEGIRRGRFRNGFTAGDTAIMQSGQIYEIVIDLPEMAHTFLPGHRIRLDVTSSNYPRYDCNLNNGGTMYVAGDTLVATNRIYHQIANASYMQLPLSAAPAGVEVAETQRKLQLFPNPATQNVTIELPNHADSELFIYDLNGSLILHTEFRNEIRVNTAKLAQGLYTVRVVSEQNVYTQKMVKQ